MRRPTNGRNSPRAAFTLLEVLLALAIGILLMGAVYVAVNVQLRHAQAGRDAVEQSTLVRGITARITMDITSSLGPAGSPTATQSASQAANQSSAGQTGASSASSTTSGSTGSSTTSAASVSVTNGAVEVNLGVQGDQGLLVLSVSRVPREFTLGPNSASGTTSLVGVSDLRRISYWLVADNGSAHGLARQEYKALTSDDALNSLPPDVPDEASYVIAEEVASLTFSYFDGASWQDSWDSTTLGPDGVTPIGPPVAIAVVLGVSVPGSPDLKYYRHVVAIPTAGYPQQNASTNGVTSTNQGTTGP